MKCPYCTKESDRVVDSREVHHGCVIRRRRECLGCKRRYTTYERIDEIPLMIVKNDGRRERFDRKKLLNGMIKACEKRPISVKDLEAVVDEVEGNLHDRTDKEIAAGDVGNFIMERLRELDQVAYVRFASVYRSFEDVHEFMDELKQLMTRDKKRSQDS